jgi:diguanylate cyclase (GGDEF)-like protein
MSAADKLVRVISASQPAVRGTDARWQTAMTLGGRLIRAAGMPAVCELAAATAARSVDAAFASVAVVEEGRRLAMQGTYGYPMALVSHVPLDLENTVIGRVFQTGRRVVNIGSNTAAAPPMSRARYRTGSFMALPIRSRGEVIAVLSVADPVGRDSFTKADVSSVSALLPIVSLAIGREKNAARAEAYARAATTDALSGLFNRRYFHSRLQEELERSRRHQTPLTLMMVDLDDFKRVNDSLGHLAGDAILCKTADILRQSVRLFDVCTRFGGDEFAIIMPGMSKASAALVAERIRDVVETSMSGSGPAGDPRATVSIGLATTVGGTTARGLVGQADQALYCAKGAGKNCVRVLEEG